MLKEIKTVTLTSKGQIVIPKEMRKRGGFTTNSKIAILAFDDHLELRPMKYLEKYFTMFASEKALAKDWLSKEDEKQWKYLQKEK